MKIDNFIFYFFPPPALNIFEKVCKTKNNKMLALPLSKKCVVEKKRAIHSCLLYAHVVLINLIYFSFLGRNIM